MKQFLVFIAILLHCNLYAQNFNIDEYFQKGLDAFENSKNEEAIFYLTPCENYYSQFSDSISKSQIPKSIPTFLLVFGYCSN